MVKQKETKNLCEAIRKIVRDTKVKCADEPGSLVNYFQNFKK